MKVQFVPCGFPHKAGVSPPETPAAQPRPAAIPAGWQLRTFRRVPTGPDYSLCFLFVLQGLAERGQRLSEFGWDS